MRRPSKRISPAAIRPGGSSRPMIDAPVSDLPAPDSPTTPRISPGAIEKEMSSSATSVPRRPGNSTRRFVTSSSGVGIGLAARGRRAAAQGLFVVDADLEVGGQPVRPHRDQVVAGARTNVERDLALVADAARSSRRPLDDDLADARVDQDFPEQRVLAVDAED